MLTTQDLWKCGMKSLAVSLVAVTALTGGAYAADAPMFEEDLLVVDDVFDWTGFYIGVHGGYGVGVVNVLDMTEDDPINGIFDYDDFSFPVDGGLLGASLGANYQMDNWVLGIEVDGQWSNIDGNRTFPDAIFEDPSAAFDTSFDTSLAAFGTARVRLGMAADRLHLFVTGGGAAGVIDTTLSFPPSGGGPVVFTDSDQEVHVGAAVGVGAEYAVTDNLIVGAGYQLVHLFGREHSYLIAGDTYTANVSLTTHMVRGELKLKF